ncbi:MAG: glycosyltransferase family 1 protein [Candidatus Binatia bacterium]|nr:glycosyltransferase family 1 protein [Candidatus Binatia bacterium]
MLHNGGIGRYIGELLEAYPGLVRNEEIVVFAHPRDHVEVRRRAPGIEIVPVTAPIYSLREHVEVAWQVRRAELDLLHVPHYVPPLGVNCAMVVTIHDLIHMQFPRSRIHSFYCRRMMAEVRRRVALVLTPSLAVAHDVEEFGGIEPDRIRVVYNGVSPGWGAPNSGPEVDAFLRRLRLEPPYVLNVTNGLPHKGLRTLLAAFRDLLPEAVRADPRGLRLVLAGQGSDRPEVREEIAECGLPPDTVLPLGGLSEREMRLAYASATAVVVASEHEGFGLPALEGMAAGVPVVASDAGGLPEVVGDAGLLFPSGSVAHLREALYTVAFELQGDEREELVQCGWDQADRFTWEGTARATLAAYERALASVT